MEDMENTAGEQEKRTFTQEELNAIIEDRLSRERKKYADYDDVKAKAAKFTEFEESQKSELQKEKERADELETKLNALTKSNSIREIREKVSAATGVPMALLQGEDEESCTAQANAIMSFAKGSGNKFPVVKDGGETHTPTMTKAEILSIKDEKQRLKAIKDHIELF